MSDIIFTLLSVVPSWLIIAWIIIVTVQESFVFSLMVYGFIKWLQVKDSPILSMFGPSKKAVKIKKEEKPSNDYLPPPVG